MKNTFDVPLSLSLFIFLMQHKGIKFSAHSLSNTLQCSVRSIYRHVDILTIAGIPVQMKKGTGGYLVG